MIVKSITPINEIARRMPEAGRIRIGMKSGRAMKAIDTFRLTSPHRDVIEQASTLYGGTPAAWHDPRARVKDQWEVITTTATLPVTVVPNGLSQWYEMWPGPARRCDGVTAQVPEARGDDYELVDTPCICRAKNVLECQTYTRVTLLLPELPFRGTWRLETKGWNAAQELPGVYEMIEAFAQQGRMLNAELVLDQRSTVTPTGRKRNFVVPTLTLTDTVHEIAAGNADVRVSISAAGEPLAIEAPEVEVIDTDIVEAEIISDAEMAVRASLVSDATQFGLDPDRFVAAVYAQLGADGALDDAQIERLVKLHRRIMNEEIEPTGFGQDGRLTWRKL